MDRCIEGRSKAIETLKIVRKTQSNRVILLMYWYSCVVLMHITPNLSKQQVNVEGESYY